MTPVRPVRVSSSLLVVLLAACETGPRTGQSGSEFMPPNSYLPSPGATDPAVHHGSPPDDPRGQGGPSGDASAASDAGPSDAGEGPPSDPNPDAYELCLVLVAFQRDLLQDDGYRDRVCSTEGRFKGEAFGYITDGGAPAKCEEERTQCIERGLPGYRGEPECYTDSIAPCTATPEELATCLEAVAADSRAALEGVTCEGAGEKLDVKIPVPSSCRSLDHCIDLEDEEEMYPFGVVRIGGSAGGYRDAGVPGDY